MLDSKGAKYVVETMWMLMEANIEEVSHDDDIVDVNDNDKVCQVDYVHLGADL